MLLPILYVASAAPMLRWTEGTHGGAVLVRKGHRPWDNWMAVYKPVVWLAQPRNSFLADPLDWWFDVWGVQWGVGLGGLGIAGEFQQAILRMVNRESAPTVAK